jgi:hypothetical protein
VDTVRGSLRYGWLNSNERKEPAAFVLFPEDKGPALKVVNHVGTPFNPADLVSFNTLEVKLEGKNWGHVSRAQNPKAAVTRKPRSATPNRNTPDR